jgi:hypothetical protein
VHVTNKKRETIEELYDKLMQQTALYLVIENISSFKVYIASVKGNETKR